MPVPPRGKLYVDGQDVSAGPPTSTPSNPVSTTSTPPSETSSPTSPTQPQNTRAPPRGKLYIDGQDVSAGPPTTPQRQIALSLLVESGDAKEINTPSNWLQVTETPASDVQSTNTYADNASPKKFDITLEDVESTPSGNLFSSTNTDTTVQIKSPETQPLLFLDQDRTLTDRERQKLPERKPAYYDPESQMAYTGLGVFLSGMGSLVRKDIDPTKLDPLAKAEYYAGRATAEVGLAFGLGKVGGSLIARSNKAVGVLERISSVGQRHEMISAATSGVLKGLFLGSEATKGIEIKMNGGTWGDVVGTLGGDFAGMYAFEEGLTSAFATTRRNMIRENFAKKNSRIFAGQTYKRSPVVVNDPNQERLTTTLLKKDNFQLEFPPRRPQVPRGTPKYDVVKLPEEVPDKNAVVTGIINTKAKPRTTFRLEQGTDDILDVSKLIKRAKNAKSPTIVDETKFIEQEKGLPEQLYTSDEKILKELAKPESPTSGMGRRGEQEAIQLTKSTLKRVNIGATRASEATRATRTKVEFYKAMKQAQNKILKIADILRTGSFLVGLGLFEGPPQRIPSPPKPIPKPPKQTHTQEYYWNQDYNIDLLKSELQKQAQRQAVATAQKQGTQVVPYWELDPNIDELKQELQRKNTRVKAGDDWKPSPPPDSLPAPQIEIPGTPQKTPPVEKPAEMPTSAPFVPPTTSLDFPKPDKPKVFVPGYIRPPAGGSLFGTKKAFGRDSWIRKLAFFKNPFGGASKSNPFSFSLRKKRGKKRRGRRKARKGRGGGKRAKKR